MISERDLTPAHRHLGAGVRHGDQEKDQEIQANHHLVTIQLQRRS